jgi:glycerate kinase
MRILVAPDKFKGSLGATKAGAVIAAGLRRAAPGRRTNKVVLPAKAPACARAS